MVNKAYQSSLLRLVDFHILEYGRTHGKIYRYRSRSGCRCNYGDNLWYYLYSVRKWDFFNNSTSNNSISNNSISNNSIPTNLHSLPRRHLKKRHHRPHLPSQPNGLRRPLPNSQRPLVPHLRPHLHLQKRRSPFRNQPNSRLRLIRIRISLPNAKKWFSKNASRKISRWSISR